MGEEWPFAGSSIFHRILLVSLHWIGGLAFGDMPFARGPRHCGQLSIAVGAAQWPASPANAGIAAKLPIARRSRRDISNTLMASMNSVNVVSVKDMSYPANSRELATPATIVFDVVKSLHH